MNKYILIATLFSALSAFAQDTNTVIITTQSTNSEDSDAFSKEITLGGGGTIVPKTGKKELGIDFSFSINPIEKVPSLWFGIEQSLAWEPKFAGSTDLLIERSTHVYKNLYLNTGWTVGAEYDSSSHVWRTGPEIVGEYYIGDSSFIYAGANYYFRAKGDGYLSFSWGIGLTFK
jgi:hypothetical protein